MNKRNKNCQENSPHTAGRAKSHWRTSASAIGMMILVMAALNWLNCSDQKDTSTEESSKVAQTGSETANNNPAPVHTTGGASIYFPEPSHDFGNIVQGDKVSHTFIVQNYGDEPLKLIKAKGS